MAKTSDFVVKMFVEDFFATCLLKIIPTNNTNIDTTINVIFAREMPSGLSIIHHQFCAMTSAHMFTHRRCHVSLHMYVPQFYLMQ